MDPVAAAYNTAILQAQGQIYFLQVLLNGLGQSPQVQVLINTTQAYLNELQATAPKAA